MSDKETIIEQIRQTFGGNEYPGDGYLQGSREGCEPFEEVGPFEGRRNWQEIEPEFLDGHYTALSFFSEAGFWFFLPAYLIADLHGQLLTADPVFHLTHGFYDLTVESSVNERIFLLKTGKSKLLNPRRYGAMTFNDYARYRLSVFTREEAAAIVAFLEFKRECAEMDFEKDQINAALKAFWLERAQTAPTAGDLQQHLKDEADYLAALAKRQ
ncbi:MAG: hypothetical protein M1438_03440 [Deltaproteobacteria bacterium]|nr:hypothetical protein [Deltaproteobacteria bacterium]